MTQIDYNKLLMKPSLFIDRLLCSGRLTDEEMLQASQLLADDGVLPMFSYVYDRLSLADQQRLTRFVDIAYTMAQQPQDDDDDGAATPVLALDDRDPMYELIMAIGMNFYLT